MEQRLAPQTGFPIRVGTDAKLVRRVGLQFVDDHVAGGTRLVDPLPVPLPVADGVEPDGEHGTLDRTGTFSG